MTSRAFLMSGAVLLFLGCATAPRDAGFADVRETLANRGQQQIELRRDPQTGDDARVRTLLEADLDADRTVAVAMTNNPRLQVILSELGFARADLLEATSVPNPILGFELRFPGRPFKPYEISLAQSILDLIYLPQRRAAGRAAFDASKMRVAGEVLAFAADVRDTFYSLVAASQKVGISRTMAEAGRVSAELAQRQHTAGNITDLDLEQEQASYEQTKLTLARDERDALLQREALTQAMGLRDRSLNWRIGENFPAPPATEMAAQETEAVLAQRRIDLIVAAREVEAARRALPAARLKGIGEVVVDVHREREPDGTKTTGPGIDLPIPIFNRGGAARARAEAQLLRAQHRLGELTASAGSQVSAARERLLAARAELEYYRDVVIPRRARIVELTKLEHNSMLVGVYQLLQARQNEGNARRDYVEAQREYWAARNEFERALNGVGPGGH